MRNKSRKLICDLLYPFGYYFDGNQLMVCFMNGYPPDGFYEDSQKVTCGTVSIKGRINNDKS